MCELELEGRNLNSRTNNALVQTFGVFTKNELTNATRSGTSTAIHPRGQTGDRSVLFHQILNVRCAGMADTFPCSRFFSGLAPSTSSILFSFTSITKGVDSCCLILKELSMKRTEIGFSFEADPLHPWSMTSGETACTGAEFERVSEKLDDSLLKAEKKAQRLKSLDLYVLGAFYYQRTQCLMVSDIRYLSPAFLRRLAAFLTAGDTKNWRIVVSICGLPEKVIIYSKAFAYKGHKYFKAEEVLRAINSARSEI